MNVVSLFAGIGGFDLGLERAGCHTVCQVENDAFCQRVLAARWPGVGRWSDVIRVANGRRHAAESRQANAPRWPDSCDLLVGGFPCQDLSVAGKRAGLQGDRSSLFYEYVRIAKALAPPWGIVENVPGLLSSHRGRDFWAVLQGLRECWPVVGWRIVDSQHFGVPQRRRRVFLVGGPTEAGVAQVLALTDGGGGDIAAGDQAGADIAYALAAGVGSRFGSGRDAQDTFVMARRTADDPNLVVELAHRGANQTGVRQGSAYPVSATQAILTHALTGEGHDASEDGTGRGTPLVVAVAQNQRGELRESTVSLQLTTGGGKPGEVYPAIRQASAVRRLTPLECERLQGFPDGWTCLCRPLEAYAADPDGAALACRCPDSPRYRALGNAVTVNVLEWLGQRLMAVLSAELRP